MALTPQPFTTRPELHGSFGMVATTHWIGSSAAMGVLERGGNAFDAAVVAGFVLHLAEPHLNGPGGDMPALVWSAANQQLTVLCGQGVAPRRATIAAFRALDLAMVPGSGLLAPCVPGAVDAWLLLLRDHGTIDIAEALAPAIHYARSGCPLVPQAVETIAGMREWFQAEWPSSAAVWLPNGEVPRAWSLFRRPELADTYERLVAEARQAGGSRERRIEAVRHAWREGFVAEAIDRFCATAELRDASGRRHRALLDGADLAAWQASWDAPLTLSYGDWLVAKCGPWTQGPVFLQQLALLRGFDLAGLAPDGPEFVHLLTEAGKLAFADREAWYGDPAFGAVPIEALLSEDYNDERRQLIGPQASLELRPGTPMGRAPRLSGIEAPAVGGAGTGEPTVGVVRGDTCHIDVVDRWGNMVAATPSGGWLQSSPMIPGLGFCLGSRAQMFWLEERLPNALAPGKRPRSTLSPSMAFREGRTALAFGTPGGDQQDQWSLQLFLKLAHHDLGLQQAIDSPAWHSEHAPSSFYPRPARPGHLAVESRLPAATITALEARGHRLERKGPWSEGRLCACARDLSPEGAVLRAAANARLMQNYAVGR
ncbi:gamma-glutamyltransferase family protein [Vulcanococcus limneticus]|uniref:gamma-glutamyltransferase family protein n=1 Tax=Vulcanococcus limneticus TaxID=2170428 RepID=UPI00398BBCBE